MISLPCAPSVVLMLADKEGPPKDYHTQCAYDDALKDAIEMIQFTEDEGKRKAPPPSAGNLSRELRKQQPACTTSHTIDITTDDFLRMTAQLEKLNDDLLRRSRGTGEEDSKFLAVDAFDPHAMDSLDKNIKSQCKVAQDLFSKNSYEPCIRVLTAVTSTSPQDRLNPYILHNIAACHYKLEEWDMVLRITRQALDMNREVDVGHRRIFRTLMITGRVKDAKELLEQHKKKSYWSGEVAAMKAYRNYESLYESHLYSHAMRELEALLRIIPCSVFETLKVQLLSLDRTMDGVIYAEERLRTYPKSADLQYWRSELRFRLASSSAELEAVLEEFEAAAVDTSDSRFRSGVKLVAKNLQMVKRIEAMKAEGRWQELVILTSTVLRSSCWSDGLVRCLLEGRALAYIKMKQWYPAFDDVCKAFHYAEDEKTKAGLFLLQSMCEEGLQRWQDAVLHAEKAHQLLRSDQSEQFLQGARKSMLEYLKKKRDVETRRRKAMEEEQRRWEEREAKEKQQRANQEAYEKAARNRRPGRAAPSSYFTVDEDGEDEPKQTRQSAQPPRPRHHETLDSYFTILRMSPTKDPTEVKKSYRALAMQWHPDKWSGRSADEVAKAEQHFKEIQNAYECIMSKTAKTKANNTNDSATLRSSFYRLTSGTFTLYGKELGLGYETVYHKYCTAFLFTPPSLKTSTKNRSKAIIIIIIIDFFFPSFFIWFIFLSAKINLGQFILIF
eukprot:gene1860-1139_t